ncbi:SDR family NAD(P)-dependent oxidoreductase [Haliangium sp.]|uniref:SDR family NAD(P)-dependent oxidoreductase n=1 Tax=Haliangium sp. TaxID=2663208 RepID=UPI003D13C56B
MTRRLETKRCLITGGSRGLGRALGEAFARAGAKVAFTYRRNQDDAEATRAALTELGAEPLVFQGSVADSAHAAATVKAVVQAWGGLDVLVNNAGVNQVLPIGLLEEEDWDEVMDVCAKGAYLFSRAALRPMIRARAGHILSIGSFASERIVEAPVHYAAAKSALRGFTEALAREVGRYNVHVNLLSPGLLDCGLAQMLPRHRIEEYLSQCPAGRVATAAEVAELATFLVSDECSFMAGAKIVADGGL